MEDLERDVGIEKGICHVCDAGQALQEDEVGIVVIPWPEHFYSADICRECWIKLVNHVDKLWALRRQK